MNVCFWLDSAARLELFEMFHLDANAANEIQTLDCLQPSELI